MEKEILYQHLSPELRTIAEKVFNQTRLSIDDAIVLYEKGSLSFLGILADYINTQKNGSNVYFNRNFHIEPTNICIYKCKFCAYSRKKGEADSWEYTIDDIAEKVSAYKDRAVTEVHIVGGVHPDRDIHFYGKMIERIKAILPNIHIKAFTAVELDYMFKKSDLSYSEGFEVLKKYGLNSIPGGGAEIFDTEIRTQLCHEKSTGEKWLSIHQKAHECGLQSNATMLYGHIETFRHRAEHMDKLRNLQDSTKGFNAFIPLKFRKNNNFLSHLDETTILEDLRNYAVCRLFLDNFQHLKAYWPMIGKDVAQIALSFGVDDIDGTIDDSTKIYTMAGVKQNNALSIEQLVAMVKQSNKIPIERDTLYNVVKVY